MAQSRVNLYALLFIAFFSFCSIEQKESYSIENSNSDHPALENIKFIIIEEEVITLEIEATVFDEKKEIADISVTLDMKFREDYQDDSLGVCIGPVWDSVGSGDISLVLYNLNDSLFTGRIGATRSSIEDQCSNYFYYVRFLSLNMKDGSSILYGVATDYSENFPDAPEVWLKDKKNGTKIIGESNIEKYSLNFTLKEN